MTCHPHLPPGACHNCGATDRETTVVETTRGPDCPEPLCGPCLETFRRTPAAFALLMRDARLRAPLPERCCECGLETASGIVVRRGARNLEICCRCWDRLNPAHPAGDDAHEREARKLVAMAKAALADVAGVSVEALDDLIVMQLGPRKERPS